MKNLKDNIRESLFSGGDIDMDSMSKNTEDCLKCEVIKKYGGKDMISGYIDVEVKNGEVYLSPSELSKKRSRPRLLQLNTEQLPKDIFPLNIKQLDGDCYSFLININTNNIKSLEEIFAPGFKNNLTSRRETSKTPLVIIIYGCDNLTSLKGCPKTVRYFSMLYNHNLKNLDGMPQWIDEEIYFSSPYTGKAYQINSSYVSDLAEELERLHKYDVAPFKKDYFEKDVKFVKDVYKHLDKNCRVARAIASELKKLK